LAGDVAKAGAKRLLDQLVHEQPPATVGKLDPLLILSGDRAGQCETGAFVHAAIGRRCGNRNAKGILHRMDRAHLIGDRTDAANAGSNIGRLGKVAATQQHFEQARWFEDL
jgi:hypothetical protein